MESKTPAICLMVLGALFGAGCGSLSDFQERTLHREQQSISRTLVEFSEAVSNKETEAAVAYLDPALPASARQRLRGAISEAMRLQLYSRYHLHPGRPMEGLSYEEVTRGRVRLKVPASNAAGERFKDRFTLVRRGAGWHIVSMKLREPVKYEVLDPPSREREATRRILSFVFEALKSGEAAVIIQRLPNSKNAHYRLGRQGWLARLLHLPAPVHSTYIDLHRVTELDILRWPDISGDLPLAYVGPLTSVAVFDIPYAYPEGGVYSDTLRLEVFVTREEGEWKLHLVRAFGEALQPAP